jgi:hypothetical protein
MSRFTGMKIRPKTNRRWRNAVKMARKHNKKFFVYAGQIYVLQRGYIVHIKTYERTKKLWEEYMNQYGKRIRNCKPFGKLNKCAEKEVYTPKPARKRVKTAN